MFCELKVGTVIMLTKRNNAVRKAFDGNPNHLLCLLFGSVRFR